MRLLDQWHNPDLQTRKTNTKEKNNFNKKERKRIWTELLEHRGRKKCSRRADLHGHEILTVLLGEAGKKSDLKVGGLPHSSAHPENNESEEASEREEEMETKASINEDETPPIGEIIMHEFHGKEMIALRMSAEVRATGSVQLGRKRHQHESLPEFIHIGDIIILTCRNDVYSANSDTASWKQSKVDVMRNLGRELLPESRFFWVAEVVNLEGHNDGEEESVTYNYYGNPKHPSATCCNWVYKSLVREFYATEKKTKKLPLSTDSASLSNLG